MILFRPTGLAELRLLADGQWKRWPPRLPEQPIFYPVLTLDYARQIARNWNTVDAFSGYVGFVTRFEVDDAFVARYPIQTVGGRAAQELWVPAEELSTFNDHIVGPIEVVESFVGEKFTGQIDPRTQLPTDF